jgi:hypothetical protein
MDMKGRVGNTKAEDDLRGNPGKRKRDENDTKTIQ